ncbi:class I SAM-dependent methyltransferase [Thalassobaculum salexigens]|uniref:class I SAM-dependent methyltransferase n=1 Tax=Thalassobaculum salexigens TaxID=455360 RepID=UPI0003FC2702|nr:class I SAM-dependent methyltransferase [Thalassobaculum salexigens]
MYREILARWDRFASAQSRSRHLPPRLLAHLRPGQSVLDIGTSDGRLVRDLLQAEPTLDITAIDSHPRAETYIPVIEANGHDVPFADNAFDTVMLIDVLHHDLHPERILREAARVARGRVLIKDHYWVTALDRAVLRLSDYLGNRAYDIPLPYNYLRLEEWRDLFAGLDARVVATETFHYSVYDRCKQVTFLLDTGCKE